MPDTKMKGITCPHCGAPYRKVITQDVLQLKCPYCGATYQTSPRIGVDISPCYNHPERFAIGICNDCEEKFCRACLHDYDFKTRDVSSTLHLCPNCLRSRQIKRADEFLVVGMALTVFGVLTAFFFLWGGAFFIIIGAVGVSYGVSKRREAVEKFTITESPRESRKKPVPAADVARMFNELLKEYIARWGARTGTELLDNEIRAYTWRGESFAYAVRKVYERQKKN